MQGVSKARGDLIAKVSPPVGQGDGGDGALGSEAGCRAVGGGGKVLSDRVEGQGPPFGGDVGPARRVAVSLDPRVRAFLDLPFGQDEGKEEPLAYNAVHHPGA